MTAHFDGAFIVDTSINAQSVLYTNMKYWYPHGRQVTVHCEGTKLTSDQVETDDSDESYFKFKVIDTSLNGKTIEVKVVAL